jgi:SSS family solute:Na+ symporter
MGLFITGIGINLWNLLAPFTAPTTAGAIAIVASLVVAPLVSIFTPKPSPKHIEAAFSCYDEKIHAPHELIPNRISG